MALQDYKCPCCGGSIEFNSNVGKMKCPFCDSEFEMDALKELDQALENDYPDFGLYFINQYFDDDFVTESIGYFAAALYLKKGLIAEGVQHLENALLISKDRFFYDFMSIDPALSEIPEVANLLAEHGFSKNNENHLPFFN